MRDPANWNSTDIAMRTYASNDDRAPGAPDTMVEPYHEWSDGPWRYPVSKPSPPTWLGTVILIAIGLACTLLMALALGVLL